jgi:hypothetical protein
MKYLISPTKQSALDRSAQIATAAGCGKKPADVTRFWFGVLEHPDTKEGALTIDTVAEETKLTENEKTALQTEAQLDAGGWFEKKV